MTMYILNFHLCLIESMILQRNEGLLC